ncbi:MAG TPA: glucosidase [Pirellulaceae bacterium]|nr:glucosidase [Pirellulaceae bacterium]
MPTPNKRLERERLRQADQGLARWRQWGPYLSERQWGTVREDYSADGNAWDAFPFEQASHRAYRWGEDGLGGVCDNRAKLCVAVALWNGRDPILKERLFGLTNAQGNHGEDVKELYYYLDATPTHSYLKMLYKYPQAEFPYQRLRDENRRRGRQDREFELLDTGIFADDRYFDVFIEYAKAGPQDMLLRITAHNRGPEAAPLHILPHIWFRNRWSWYVDTQKPMLMGCDDTIEALHGTLGSYTFYCDQPLELLFTENETNNRKLFGVEDGAEYCKDGIEEYLVKGTRGAVNPKLRGTKAAAHHASVIPAGGSMQVRLRWTSDPNAKPWKDFDTIFADRIHEADEFYNDFHNFVPEPDAQAIQRQAFAGMIWNKQFYRYDVRRWLQGDPAQPTPPKARLEGRNKDWTHLNNADIISMPDKWEYPWYAAWDTAFHCLPLALIDPEFAKEQLIVMTREWYMHPNGQMPAYEWKFDDVNPPVHGWAAWRVFQIDRKLRGDCGDIAFLERVFHKLLLNFTWWVNRKDEHGRNIFQGGFLGLDNIGLFDRSQPLPTGGYINQTDGTAWMAMYSLNLMRIALELSLHNPVYQDVATKFFEHFLYIAEAMTNMGGHGSGIGLWDDEDKFYYDELNLPDGQMIKLKVRSMVGLIPLFAVETIEPELLKRLPEFAKRLDWIMKNRPELAALVSHWDAPGRGERRLLSLLRGHRMKRLLSRMLDETEFLSDYGVRALSRHHQQHPYDYWVDGVKLSVNYEPGEAEGNLFGGNSNWRGPVWFPVNYLIIESLQKFHHYYGDDFKIECPTRSGNFMTLAQAADELSKRLQKLFLRNAAGQRPVFGNCTKLQTDPHFRDYIPFFEYFHGDTGRGCGASHQTGWTGLVAKLIQPRYEHATVMHADLPRRAKAAVHDFQG